MNRVSCLIRICLMLAAAAAAALAEVDPGDVYSRGYIIFQRGVKTEQQQDLRGALRLYREASEVFDSVAQRWPAWQPTMVDYRRKLVRGDVQRLAGKFAVSGGRPNEPELPQHSGTEIPVVGASPVSRPNFTGRPPAVPTPQERFKNLESMVQRLTSEREKLIRQLNEKQSDQKAAKEALTASRKQVAELQAALEKSQQELVKLKGAGVEALQAQIEDLKKQLAQATQTMSQANERTAKLLADLEEANKVIADLRQQQELFKRERIEMAELIKGLPGEEGVGQLATENIQLREQLNATQAKLDELQATKDQDRQQLEDLLKEVSDLRSQLAQAQQENEDYKAQLQELQGTLVEVDQNLSLNPPAAGDNNASEENALLKSIITKHLQQQTHRQQIKELVIQDLKETENVSNEILAKIEDMAGGGELSDSEREVIHSNGLGLGQSAISSDVPVVEEESLRRKITRYAKAAAYDFTEGNFEKAEAGYEEILQFSPQHVRTLLNLGVVKVRLNKLDEAKVLCEKALLHDPENAFTHYMLGIAQFHLDELEGASLSLKQSTERDATNADAYHFLAVTYLKQDQLEQAREALERAVELRPSFSEAHFNLAVVYLRKKPSDLAKARQHYALATQAGLAPDESLDRLFAKGSGSGLEASPQPVLVAQKSNESAKDTGEVSQSEDSSSKLDDSEPKPDPKKELKASERKRAEATKPTEEIKPPAAREKPRRKSRPPSGSRRA